MYAAIKAGVDVCLYNHDDGEKMVKDWTDVTSVKANGHTAFTARSERAGSLKTHLTLNAFLEDWTSMASHLQTQTPLELPAETGAERT